MQPATTLTIASVGCLDPGVGHVLEADVTGRVDGGCTHAAILPRRSAAAPSLGASARPGPGVPIWLYLISEIPWSA